MSHVTSAPITITDLDCLWAAVKTIKQLKAKVGQKTHRWYQGGWQNDYSSNDAAYKRYKIKPENYGKCEHAIECAGSDYDIGVVALPTGGYALVWDFFGTGHQINHIIGKQGEVLLKAYNRELVRKQAKLNGWAVREKKLANGEINLQLTPSTVQSYSYQKIAAKV